MKYSGNIFLLFLSAQKKRMWEKNKDIKALVQYADVLEEELNKNLLNYIVGKEKSFKYTGGANYSEYEIYHEWRKSKVIYRKEFADFIPPLEKFIREHFEEVCASLRIEPFAIHGFDFQLTSHNDGEQFKLHKDKSTPITENRMVTFVYYFHSKVKKFSGGELLFPEGGRIMTEPVNNTIVFFNPTHTHEVLQVSCPSKKFEDGRFTINGWILKEIKPEKKPTLV
jgi:Rps23 Pro-64 3,4-dihydroxylase Tpa1-like proline 4-hydroxylase